MVRGRLLYDVREPEIWRRDADHGPHMSRLLRYILLLWHLFMHKELPGQFLGR